MFVLGTNRFGTMALLYPRAPPPTLMLLMTHQEKTQLKALPLALTLTLGGYESAIVP